MSSFFHGWRRKAGCVALVMACVFMGGWIGSLTNNTTVALCDGPVIYYFSTGYHGLELETHAECPPRSAEYNSGFPRNFSQAQQPIELQTKFAGWKFQKPFLGIKSAEIRPFTTDRWRVLIIPYSYIVLPLTLLSAYLMLWKPRKPKSSGPSPISNLISN
jgi:hypothetical protein